MCVYVLCIYIYIYIYTDLYLFVLGMEKLVPLEDLALLPRCKHGEGATFMGQDWQGSA